MLQTLGAEADAVFTNGGSSEEGGRDKAVGVDMTCSVPPLPGQQKGGHGTALVKAEGLTDACGNRPSVLALSSHSNR